MGRTRSRQLGRRLRARSCGLLIAWGATIAVGRPVAAGDAPPAYLTASIPQRLASAPTGSQLVAQLRGLDPIEREQRIVSELVAGNMPTSLRRLRPVELHDDGDSTRIVVWVMPDYLAVGTDDDFVRVPLGLESSLEVARRLRFVLPTTRLVDAIYEQSAVRLSPQPMTPCAAMVSVDYFVAHNRAIEAQRRKSRGGGLVAGHKKDVVLCERLAARPGRVAIYGWHRGVNDPIQPLSTVHQAGYADYSHGVRLVSEVVRVDGRETSLLAVLESPRLAPLVSVEGTIDVARALMSEHADTTPITHVAFAHPSH